MAVLGLLLYVVSAAIGFAAGYYLPAGAWTPYVPVVLSYHIFLAGLIVLLGVSEEQEIGISLGIPMTVLSHAAFVGALIGVVFMREYVPLFNLLRYVLPGLAPFEAKWLFEGKKKARTASQPQRMPEATQDDHTEFLEYLRQKNRRFERPGRSVNEEFGVWLADRAKRRAEEAEEQGLEISD